MKQREQKLVEGEINITKQKTLKVQTATKPQFDDRWMEFKFISKNLQPRSYHASSIYQNYLFVYGGYDVDKGILSDFYKLNLENTHLGFKWEQMNQNKTNYPGKLKSHTCITYQNSLVIFGGQTKTGENNKSVYIYYILQDKWDRIIPNIEIPALDSHCAVLRQNKMLVYGGFMDKKAKYNKQILEFDLKTLKWTFYYQSQSKFQPQPRGNFGMVLYDNYLWIFGGTNGTKTLNDLWKFNLIEKKWQEIKCTDNVPEPRRSHSMLIYENYFYIFGGIQDVTKQKNDVYIFNFLDTQWSKILHSSNLIYECSPTMKNNRSIEKKKNNSPKKFQNKISLINSNLETSPKEKNLLNTDKSEVMKRILEENKLKKFYEKKIQLLKQFSQSALQNNKQKRKLSPTSQNMAKTLLIIGDQQQNKQILHKQVIYDITGNFLLGKKPCARDAQTAALYRDKMIIFGGDRHLMSFSDLYYFDLKKGIQSKKYYQNKN